MTANREFLKRLKTRDIVVLEGKDIKIAKVGYRGHKIVRKFVLDSVQDMLTYSADTYYDAIKTAQVVSTPAIAVTHENIVMTEVEQLRNRGGYYLIKFQDIEVTEGKETGDWKVRLKLDRIYKNELKEKEVKKIELKLTVQDTNTVARAGIEERPEVNPIGMIITSMNFTYIK